MNEKKCVVGVLRLQRKELCGGEGRAPHRCFQALWPTWSLVYSWGFIWFCCHGFKGVRAIGGWFKGDCHSVLGLRNPDKLHSGSLTFSFLCSRCFLWLIQGPEQTFLEDNSMLPTMCCNQINKAPFLEASTRQRNDTVPPNTSLKRDSTVTLTSTE